MKKLLFTLACVSLSFFVQAQSKRIWKPAGADTTFPRITIHSSEIAAVKASLAAGKNIELYQEVYNSAGSVPPTGNDNSGDRLGRAQIAKNAAFVALLNVKPSGQTTVPLLPAERDQMKAQAINLLMQLNSYIHPLSADSPLNFDEWQWNSKEIIQYASAYDLLRGAGYTHNELVSARAAVKKYTGNLFAESTRSIAGLASFFQGAKNNHALMTAGAIGVAAVAFSDSLAGDDTSANYNPVSWVNTAMWNIHNVIWWDIKKQSVPGKFTGYAEGTYYFRYGFANLLPFFRGMGCYTKDTSVIYDFKPDGVSNISRKLRNPWFDTNYVRIYDWVTAMRFPDGRMPPLEDSYTYSCFPELAILRKPKYVWPVHLSQQDADQFNSLSKQLTNIYDMRAEYISSNITPVNTIDSLFLPMPDAGAAVFRSGWDSSATYLALLGKNGTTLASTDAHNHADDASFIMMTRGQMMAMDPGYLSFIFRDSVAHAKAHNMILVDNVGPNYGFPGKTNGAETYIEKFFKSGVQNYAEARTSYEGADINRKVMHVRGKYFLLVDHMSSSTPRQYSWLLHGYGLEGGTTIGKGLLNTGLFTDLTASKRMAWKRNNSGLYAYINSDQPFSIAKEKMKHEYSYQMFQEHTLANATNTVPSTGMSYMTCLQTYSDLAADTFPVVTLNIPGATAYKITDGQYTDIAVTRTFGSAQLIAKTTTGLSADYTTNAQFVWSSEKSGAVEDLFMYKGSVLIKNNDTLVAANKPVNIQFLQTGARSYKGYVGDSGSIRFFTHEYPFRVLSKTHSLITFDAASGVTTVYFNGASSYSIEVDDLKTGMSELTAQSNKLSAFPNPANDRITFKLTETAPENSMLEMWDLTGKMLKQVRLEGQQREFTLSCGDLLPGIYFARVTDVKGNASAAVKVMIGR